MLVVYVLILGLCVCAEVMSSRGFDYNAWKVVNAKNKWQAVVPFVVSTTTPATKRQKTSGVMSVKEFAPTANEVAPTP